MTEIPAKGVRGSLLLHIDADGEEYYFLQVHAEPAEKRVALMARRREVQLELSAVHDGSSQADRLRYELAEIDRSREHMFRHKNYRLRCEDIEVELTSNYNALFEDDDGKRWLDFASHVTNPSPEQIAAAVARQKGLAEELGDEGQRLTKEIEDRHDQPGD